VLVLVRCVLSWDLASTYKGVVCLTRHSFTCNRDITTVDPYFESQSPATGRKFEHVAQPTCPKSWKTDFTMMLKTNDICPSRRKIFVLVKLKFGHRTGSTLTTTLGTSARLLQCYQLLGPLHAKVVPDSCVHGQPNAHTRRQKAQLRSVAQDVPCTHSSLIRSECGKHLTAVLLPQPLTAVDPGNLRMCPLVPYLSSRAVRLL
jgi:hypothetical protein